MRNIAVTAAAILIALAVVVSVFLSSKPEQTPPAGSSPATGNPTTVVDTKTDAPATVNTDSPVAAVSPAAPADSIAPTTQPAAAVPALLKAPTGLKVKPFTQARVATIGSNDKNSGFDLQLDLSAWGASILSATTTKYDTEANNGHPYPVQQFFNDRHSVVPKLVMPFAARFIVVDKQQIDLAAVRWELKSPSTYRLTLLPDKPADAAATQPANIDSQAVYSVTIVDENDQPVLEITRTWSVAKASYQVQLKQEIKNLSGRALNVQWSQLAMGDTPADTAYLGDRRLDVVGYFDVGYNPTRQIVYTTGDTIYRANAVTEFETSGAALWPYARSYSKTPDKAELVWLAYRNRYFSAAVFRPVDENELLKPGGHLKRLDDLFPHVGVEIAGLYNPSKPYDDHSSVYLTMTSAPMNIAPGQSENLNLSIYTGPLDPQLFKQAPYNRLGFSDMIIYSLGGMCGFCTFQWLAKFLLSFLHLTHYLTGDWGIAIILLVLVVRLILHPITKRSQINMTKMGKQMAAVQPEIEKLKKKYANDPTALNAETLKLYREKNINPLNMLGCLPMFLQMPIWIALYAMLYFAIELRHEPAFWGVFQWVSNGNWHFFADLSSPDRLIVFFDQPKVINLFIIIFDYSSFNIMPILMGVMFIINQKLTAPPAISETARQQQKMMMWITVLFPFMLYSAPSGLTLYIFASTAAGIVDSLIVKRHIAREEAAGTLFKVDPKKKPGFLEMVQKMVEAQQQRLEAQEKNKKDGKGK